MKAPFQNAVMEEEQFEEDDETHCLEDKGNASFFTSAAYEKSLCNDQISQEWDGEAILQTVDQQRYNLRSKINNAKETHVQRAVVPTVQQANNKKQPADDPIVLQALAHEVRGVEKSPSPFSFEP